MPSAPEGDQPFPASADLSNWRSSPINRWAFHHVKEIIPSAGIAAPGETWMLPADAAPALGDFKLTGETGETLPLKGVLAATSTDAMVILHRGRIVFEHYAGGNGPHTPHILMSATKSVIGLIVGILVERGALDPEAQVSRYVPEIADTAYAGATVRQLIDMRTGVALGPRQLNAYDTASGWVPAKGSKQGLHAFFAQMTAPRRDHGGPFAYVSANTDLLGWVSERAAGQSFAALAQSLLWGPMGAEDGAYITLDPKGAPRCTGGLCATARDFARIGQLMADGGRREDRQVAPRGWIEDICRNGDHTAWADGEWGKLFSFAANRMSYRSGWYVIDDAPQILFAMGVYGQNLFIDRANGIVVAKLSSLSKPVDYAAITLTHRAISQIFKLLSTS
jgi:CubicO group peptidase (beta-lactamase class C family)